MRKRNLCLGVGTALVLLISCLSPGSFAQGIELYPGLLRNAAMSDQAMESWRTSFENLKQGLAMIAEGLLPDQQDLINQAIAIIDIKLTTLQSIDVYTIAEKTSGEAFSAIRDFYKTRMVLEDINGAQFKQELLATSFQGGPREMFPRLPLSQAAIEQLIQLIDQNKFQAVSGEFGKSKIWVLTAYVNPHTSQIVEGTTVVIETDK